MRRADVSNVIRGRTRGWTVSSILREGNGKYVALYVHIPVTRGGDETSTSLSLFLAASMCHPPREPVHLFLHTAATFFSICIRRLCSSKLPKAKAKLEPRRKRRAAPLEIASPRRAA